MLEFVRDGLAGAGDIILPYLFGIMVAGIIGMLVAQVVEWVQYMRKGIPRHLRYYPICLAVMRVSILAMLLTLVVGFILASL